MKSFLQIAFNFTIVFVLIQLRKLYLQKKRMEDRKNIRNELWKINLCDKCKIFNEKLTQRDLQFFHVQFCFQCLN